MKGCPEKIENNVNVLVVRLVGEHANECGASLTIPKNKHVGDVKGAMSKNWEDSSESQLSQSCRKEG